MREKYRHKRQNRPQANLHEALFELRDINITKRKVKHRSAYRAPN
jgi:hypothetical protein